MGNENSQLEGEGGDFPPAPGVGAGMTPGTSTPMSEPGFPSAPYDLASRPRRASSASLTQPPSPVEALDLDMSHLSEEEKAQIAAVIARARELQEEGAQRVRDIEEDFAAPLTPPPAVAAPSRKLPSRAADVEAAAQKVKDGRCPICEETNLTADNQTSCVDCTRAVCCNCGSYEAILTTKTQEWLCNVCRRKRHLTSPAMTLQGQRPRAKEKEAKERQAQPGPPASVERGASEDAVRRNTANHQQPPERVAPVRRQGSLPSATDQERARQQPDVPAAHPKRHSRERHDKPRDRRDGTGTLDEIRDAPERTRGVGQSPDLDIQRGPLPPPPPLSVQPLGPTYYPPTDGVGPEDMDYDMREDAASPGGSTSEEGGRRKSPRPQHLVLGQQHVSGSAVSGSSGNANNADAQDNNHGAPLPIQPDRRQQHYEPSGNHQHQHQHQHQQERVDHDQMAQQYMRTQPRAGAEGAEVEQAGGGPHPGGAVAHSNSTNSAATAAAKKKPSALDRVTVSDHRESVDRSQSPSRRSPAKSPPRSPSWMRFRESPPRSPPYRTISPSLSPTERFPTTYGERTSPGLGREEAYGEEALDGEPAFSFDQNDLNNFATPDCRAGAGAYPDKPPPKPARLSDQYQFQQDEELQLVMHDSVEYLTPHAIDLAAYAAAVASDTAHLTTCMSVSPTNLVVPEPNDLEYLDVSPEQDSISPPSPGYYEELEEMDVSDPTPKSIDYQGSKRQRIKPPATDWSPVTDLSPILDVSPSVERLEQEEMIAEQQQQHQEAAAGPSEPHLGVYAQRPQRLHTAGDGSTATADGDKVLSPLKRYQAFDDISLLGNGEIPGKGETRDESHKADARISDRGPVPSTKHAPPTTTTTTASQQAEPHYSELKQDPNGPWKHPEPAAPPDPNYVRGLASKFDHPDTGAAAGEHVRAAPQSAEQSRNAAVAQKRIPLHEETCDVKEIDLDEDVPPKDLMELAARGDGGKKLKRSLPEPTPEILATARKPLGDVSANSIKHQPPSSSTSAASAAVSSSVVRSKVQQTVSHFETKGNTQAEYDNPSATCRERGGGGGAGELERSSSTESTKSKDSSSSSAKKPQSPGSESDSSKKIRRKLPPLPPEADSSESHQRTQRPKAVESAKRADPINSDKETLRRRLQEKKEAEQRLHHEKPPNHHAKKQQPADSKPSAPAVASKPKPQPRPQSAPSSSSSSTSSSSSSSSSSPSARSSPAKPKVPPKPAKPQDVHATASPAVKPPQTDNKMAQLKENGPTRSKPTPPPPTHPPPPPPPPKPKVSPKKKSDKPVETVNVHGIVVPVEIKSLKQRIKEEIQIATASRRLQLDESEEIRRMEHELADREKERKLKADEEERVRLKLRAEREKEREREIEREREREKEKEMEKLKMTAKLKEKEELLQEKEQKAAAQEKAIKFDPRRKVTPPAATLSVLRMSPQASPRRGRHKRQNSDPMIAKFSPIEEDRDIENELSYKLGLEARRIATDIGRFSPQPVRVAYSRRLGTVTPPETELDDDEIPGFRQPFLTSSLSRSSEVLGKYSIVERDARLSSSQSESNLPMTASPRSRTPTYFSDDDDRNRKEEKKLQLQIEIEKRKRQIEQNARLQYELRKLTESADISRQELEEAKERYQQHMRARDSRLPMGIIKPIDYEVDAALLSEELAQREYLMYRDYLEKIQIQQQQQQQEQQQQLQQQQRGTVGRPGYSSSEYVVHRADPSPPKHEQLNAFLAMTSPGDYYPADVYLDERMVPSTAELYRRAAAEGLIYPGLQPPPPPDKAGGMMPVAFPPPPPAAGAGFKGGLDSDPQTALFRAESELSLAESDDNVMEGGVTIRRQSAKKQQSQDQSQSEHSTPPPPRKYDFPTKRILLTRDPKDKTVKGTIKGNGIGMKIVGGKILPGTDGDIGAYVAAIYTGGVAEQLHGELQEGDQVLEWNGTSLSGKSYEEVQHIIALPNGEIELVVRPGANLGGKHSSTMSTIRTDSCHSSYDNLDFPSDYDDFDRYLDPADGVDPDVLAAQLEDIQDHLSAKSSPSSSQPDMYQSASMSTPGSSEPTDPPSPSLEIPTATVNTKSHAFDSKENMGDIQLQLSFDTYDGTLNVHVIQARNLQAKDKNGLSDPFVKVYLLPGRSIENKRRTKYIAKTLDPEWHQTLVFMNIPRAAIKSKSLEVTVWDYDRFKPNDFLGEVLLDLSDESYLDNKPHWYRLHEHDENNSAYLPKPRTLSPPHSSSSSTSHRSRSAGGGAKDASNHAPHGHIHGSNQSHGGHGGPGGQGHSHSSGRSHGAGGGGSGSGSGAGQGPNSRSRGHSPNSSSQRSPSRSRRSPSSSQRSPSSSRRSPSSSRRSPSSSRRSPSTSRSQASSHRDPSPAGRKSRGQSLTAPTDKAATKYSPGLGRKPARSSETDNISPSPKSKDSPQVFQKKHVISQPRFSTLFEHVPPAVNVPTAESYETLVPPSSPCSFKSDLTLSRSSFHTADTTTTCSLDSSITRNWSPVLPPRPRVKRTLDNMRDVIPRPGLRAGQLLPLVIRKGLQEEASYIVTGDILLGLKKYTTGESLTVTVVKCKGMASSLDRGTKRDWFVKLYVRLASELKKVKKRRTNAQRVDTDPSFNEIFHFHTDGKPVLLEVSLLMKKTGMFSRTRRIGEALIALDKVSFRGRDGQEIFHYYKLLAERRN